MGSWKPDGVKLTRESEDTYIGELDLKPGQKLEFKLTLGSWDTVEKNVDGTDRRNRTVVLDSDTRQIEVTVASWAATHKHEASTVVGELRVHKMDSRH